MVLDEFMKRLFVSLYLISQFTYAQELAKMTVYENGQAKTIYYDNTYPQCVSFKFFVGNTMSQYKGAYIGNQSLKKADENVSRNALSTVDTVLNKNLPLPYSPASLMKDAAAIKKIIFSGQEVDREAYISKAYDSCVNTLVKNGYSDNSNSNYDQKVNYSKGEDKIKKEKITKVSQLCGDPKFNEIMEGARSDIRLEAINRKYTIDNFIKKSGYASIDVMAEKMIQAQLNGKIRQQFLYEVYLDTKRKDPYKVTEQVCVKND